MASRQAGRAQYGQVRGGCACHQDALQSGWRRDCLPVYRRRPRGTAADTPVQGGQWSLGQMVGRHNAFQAGYAPPEYRFTGKGSRKVREQYLAAVIQGYRQNYDPLALSLKRRCWADVWRMRPSQPWAKRPRRLMRRWRFAAR